MSIFHAVPINDTRQHVEDRGGCWCEPTVRDLGLDEAGEPARVYDHHAADGREHARPDHDRARCSVCRESDA